MNTSDIVTETEGLDLDLDLNAVDTSYPTLAVGKPYEVTVVKAEVSPWKKDPSSKSLVITVATTSITTSSKGEELAPGFKQTFRINLQQGHNAQGEAIGDFKKDIARALDAIFGTDQTSRPRLNAATIAEMTGKTVKAIVKARKDSSDGFGETEIKYLEPASV